MSSSQVELPYAIAIDGPAASGKSTLARRLAQELGYLYFDTGVMYRAVTLAVLERKLDPNDEARVTELTSQLDIDVLPGDGSHPGYRVILNGEDVTGKIRSTAVDRNVSIISTYAGVRQAMTVRQRQIGGRGRVVMVGRDIGTVVLPRAKLKIFVEASLDARARRRHRELQQAGQEVPYDDIRRALEKRDQIDSDREVAPLLKAPDAVVLDNSDLTIEDTVQAALQIVRSRMETEES